MNFLVYTFSVTIFQHAHALEILSEHLHEGARALDVGSGSGYLTACMALLVGTSIFINTVMILLKFSDKLCRPRSDCSIAEAEAEVGIP